MKELNKIIKLAGLHDIEDLIDSSAIDSFSKKMLSKLEQKRHEGRHGWWDEDQCDFGDLVSLLESHLEKAITYSVNPGVKIDIDRHQLIDIANLAMFIYFRAEE